jgi:hypothetical protein
MRTIKRLALLAPICWLCSLTCFSAPTDGWISDKHHFEIQSPYDLPHTDRYTFDPKTDTHHLWVFDSDKPMAKHNTTKPRTEMSFDKYDSGFHQFEADVLVPSGTNNVTIMQVFGGPGAEGDSKKHATALQLRINGGNLKRYNEETILSDTYDKWFHLNVTHDVNNHEIQIFIDGKLSLTTKDFGGEVWHFKCGVYAQPNPSSKMEVLYRNIRLYHK